MNIGTGTAEIETGAFSRSHTGLAATAAAIEDEHCSTETGCITCGDVALPLEVLEVDEARGLALCRDEGDRRETVETALVLPVAPGDSLLVHAGTAISHLGQATGTPGREAEDVPEVSGAVERGSP